MTRGIFIFKSIFIKFVKSFFILYILFSGLFISYAAPTEEPCTPTGYSDALGGISGSDDCLTDPSGATVNNVNSQAATAAKNEECGGKDNFDCYTLLEPYGAGGEEGVTNTLMIKRDGLGTYLQTLMSYLLIIITIAAVFYMVYGGALYLTTDMVSQKSEGREVITRVIIGLIFVFSVWTIMNSINSGLLKNALNFSLKDLGVVVKSVVSGQGLPPSDTIGQPTPVPTTRTYSTPPGVCKPEDIVTVSGIKVCSSISENFTKLINAASSAGITLTASGSRAGWRSMEEQEALRAEHCGGSANAYNPKASCSPKTALPGYSNHQSGKAVDFKEAGNSNGGYNSNAYKWLKTNASTYGFFNSVPNEPWHWSTTGR